MLLQHPSEVNHALNTARLAALGLVNAQLVVGEVFEDLQALLNPPGYRNKSGGAVVSLEHFIAHRNNLSFDQCLERFQQRLT